MLVSAVQMPSDLFTSPWPPPPHTKKYSPSGHAAPYSAMPYFASFGLCAGFLPMAAVKPNATLGDHPFNVWSTGSFLLLRQQQLLRHCCCVGVPHSIAHRWHPPFTNVPPFGLQSRIVGSFQLNSRQLQQSVVDVLATACRTAAWPHKWT